MAQPNPSVPEGFYVQLRKKLRSAEVLADIPITRADELDKIAGYAKVELRIQTALNPNFRYDTLLKLANDKNPYVRQSIAERKETPEGLRQELIEDLLSNHISKAEEFTSLASAEFASEYILALLSKFDRQSTRHEVGKNINTPLTVLEALAKDSDAHVRAGVAGNVRATPEILALLAKGSNQYVRAKVAANAYCPVDLLTELTDVRNNTEVRMAVASNTSTPPLILQALSRDPEYSVRQCALRNKNIPNEVISEVESELKRRAADRQHKPKVDPTNFSDEGLRAGLLHYVKVDLSASKKSLERLAKHNDWIHRTAAALHPDTANDVLDLLCEDSDIRVKAVAKAQCSEQ